MDKHTSKCPDYVEYSKHPHPPYSSPEYQYPYMRPAPKCRTFVSSAVEKLVQDLVSKVKNPDLARLIENCLPNTLDTTILWHAEVEDHRPQTFVVTGDIHAEWLRDAARQLSVYQPLIKHDEKLQTLILGAINTQAYYVNNSPYCNAFHPPPHSGVKKGSTAMDDVHPRPDWKQVFECKYEIDSLASFLTLSNEYFEHADTKVKPAFITPEWLRALEKLLIVLRREAQPSFDEDTGQALPYYYSFQRHTNIGSETLALGGVGNPVNFGTGLIRSAFRPSDDATVLQFFIPGNAHMVTELIRARKMYLNADMIDGIQGLTSAVDEFIAKIGKGIQEHGIVQHPKYGKVYAYEVDGYGGSLFMDDANIPSLLALPDMGFTSVDDPVYQNTRKMILAKEGNPYYLKGAFFEGIGGPHVGIRSAWPMSLLVRMRTTDDDEEILRSLKLVMETTAGLGLMHETVDVNSRGGHQYSRSWFAWCNSEFGKTILHLAKHKPHLIFKDEFSQSYDIDKVLS
ncbi:uncharacterized protein SPAPADRAFT_57566 [Spathaspora passalidarum NRRL Y-27907]|uniref:Glycoside hydrolase family 125 protein n=1 Tax=Spathaspora passalidarum (strain NRRL Y-27907 / 11-Y1) TaxID=619300 RepID=G3AV36_SPAPN|nr:uncharacterized protein SPAPADRAFT_57566 [Spathaspora passalidarum NRRL Y-27907]EGW30110.1 hypothetical protein SPAPADRAFT_57566 [Spathaspora passalidarum NRRL Y-27907]